MEEIIGIILLIGIVIMCLPIVGFLAFIGVVLVADDIQDRRLKKIQRNGGLGKDEWRAGEKE